MQHREMAKVKTDRAVAFECMFGRLRRVIAVFNRREKM